MGGISVGRARSSPATRSTAERHVRGDRPRPARSIRCCRSSPISGTRRSWTRTAASNGPALPARAKSMPAGRAPAGRRARRAVGSRARKELFAFVEIPGGALRRRHGRRSATTPTARPYERAAAAGSTTVRRTPRHRRAPAQRQRRSADDAGADARHAARLARAARRATATARRDGQGVDPIRSFVAADVLMMLMFMVVMIERDAAAATRDRGEDDAASARCCSAR